MVSENNVPKTKSSKLSGVHIAIGAFAIFGFAILTLIAASGMVYIPGLTEILGTDKPVDLGVKADPVLFDNMVKEQGVTLAGPASSYMLTSDIAYSDTAPMDISLSSDELSSYLQATNNAGPLKDIQVRLGSGNQAEMSAYIDLNDFGYNFKGPVYAEGTFEKASDNSVKLDISGAKVGLLPLPSGSAAQGEQELENLINSHLSKMPGLNIESLEVEDGNLNFKGDFPRTFETTDT